MYADFTSLCKNLKAHLQMYEYDQGKQPNTHAVAQLLSRMLYGKRFFP